MPILSPLDFYHQYIMNGNRASGLRRRYSGPSQHGGNGADPNGIIPKGDFRQTSHTNEKTLLQGQGQGQGHGSRSKVNVKFWRTMVDIRGPGLLSAAKSNKGH